MFRQGRQGRARGARARLRRAGAFRRARVPAGWPPCWEEDRRKGRQKVRGGTPLQGGQAVQRDGVNTTRHARRGREMADGRAQGLEAPRPAAQAALSNAGPDSAGAIAANSGDASKAASVRLCNYAAAPGLRGSARARRRPSKRARAGRALCVRAKKDAGQGDKAAGRRRALGERRENTPPSPSGKARNAARQAAQLGHSGQAFLQGFRQCRLRSGGGGGGRRKRRRASPPPPHPPPLRAEPHAARGSRRMVVHLGRIPARQESSARPNASMTRFAPAWCSRTSSKVTWTYRPCALLFLFSTMIL